MAMRPYSCGYRPRPQQVLHAFDATNLSDESIEWDANCLSGALGTVWNMALMITMEPAPRLPPQRAANVAT